MRILRFVLEDSPRFGVVEDASSRVVVLKGDPLFSPIEPSGQIVELDEVRLLSPVIPRSKVVGVARNYDVDVSAQAEGDPSIFLKPNTSVIGPGDPIILPPWSDHVVFEGELAVVIKTLAKDVPVDKVDDVIFGYTCVNDVSARDAVVEDGPWTRAKSFDTSCPVGPWITVDPTLDPDNLHIRTFLNGDLKQDATTAHMLTSVRELVAFVSSCFTLLPGDIIATGTPAGADMMSHGDEVEIDIESIGTLTNPVHRL